MARFFQKTGSARALAARKTRDRVVGGMRMGMGAVILPDQGLGLKPPGSTPIRSAGTGDHVLGAYAAKAARRAQRRIHAVSGLGAIMTPSQGYGRHVIRDLMPSQGRGEHRLTSLGDDLDIGFSSDDVYGSAAYNTILLLIPVSNPFPRGQLLACATKVLSYVQFVIGDGLALLKQDPVAQNVSDLGSRLDAAIMPVVQQVSPYVNQFKSLYQSKQDPVYSTTFAADSQQIMYDAYRAVVAMYDIAGSSQSAWNQMKAGLNSAAAATYTAAKGVVDLANKVADTADMAFGLVAWLLKNGPYLLVGAAAILLLPPMLNARSAR